ncbi:MAG: hypothetical protein ACRDI2_13755 [Chloroflexota bacterium]
MPPRWGEVREFCRKQGYQETRTGHIHYLKVLPDRSTSGTMVSLGVDGQVVPSSLWVRVWRRQLRLTSEEEFWKGLRGELVTYAIPPTPASPEPLPAYLLRFLRDTLHLPDAQIAPLTREQAQQLLNDYYSREVREG